MLKPNDVRRQEPEAHTVQYTDRETAEDGEGSSIGQVSQKLHFVSDCQTELFFYSAGTSQSTSNTSTSPVLVYSVDSIDASLEHGAREFLHRDILNDVSMLSGSTSQLQSSMQVTRDQR